MTDLPLPEITEALLPYCFSERQREFVNTVIQKGSAAKAARALKVDASVLYRALGKIRKRAAREGYAPGHWEDGVPPGYQIGKVTIERPNPDGTKRWERLHPTEEAAQERLNEWVDNLAERGVTGKSAVVKVPGYQNDELLAIYPMGDPHFGMVALAEEAGEDFDLEQVERELLAGFDRVIAAMPPAKTALIAELGDFFHSDNEQNRTRRSGNSLDADRWSKVMQVGFNAMIACIEKVAAKHENVIVRIVRGNHDEQSSFALSMALHAYFRNQPRITVVVKNCAHWYYEFGKNLIGLTHGDTTKPADLPGLMSVDCREAWGRTLFRYYLHGHIHNKRLFEQYGVIVESFRTLAGKDAWHAWEGYRSGQDMHGIVLHREFGEVLRTRADITLIRQPKKKTPLAA